MKMGDQSVSAASMASLRQLWLVYSDTNEARIRRITFETMFPRELTVSLEQPAQGYVVFYENFPKEGGDARVVFVLSTPDGESLSLEVPMNFGVEKNSFLKEKKQKPQG